MKRPIFGFHESIAGGLYRAVERAADRGLKTLQVFTRNPRGWKSSELKEEDIVKFRKKLSETGIGPVVAHMPYLPNLSGPDPETFRKSVESLKAEIERCDLLGIPYLVTHTGSHRGEGYEAGLRQIQSALTTAIEETPDANVWILLENTAGTKNSMGTRIEELWEILDLCSKYEDRLGICLDTAHAWGGGYDISTERGVQDWLEEFDGKIGLDRLKVIHMNDSPVECGSGVDRHWHIGEGKIGEECFRTLLKMERLAKLPRIMETPLKEKTDNLRNQETVERLLKE